MSILKLLKTDCLVLIGSLGNILIQRTDKTFVTLQLPPNDIYELMEELKQELGFVEVQQDNPGVCLINPSVVKYYRYVHYKEMGVVNCELFFGRGQSEYFVKEFGDVLEQQIPHKKLPDWTIKKGSLKNKK